MDMLLILHSLEKDLESSNSWNLARKALESYIEANDIKPESFHFHDVGDHYLWPLLRSYFENQRSFLFHSSRARKKIAHLLKHLDASSTRVFGLVALERFSAPRAFSLDRSIRLRPISETDIRMLGRTDYVVPPGRYRFPNPLCDDFPLVHSDWWICEIELPNSRGTADGYNALHNLMDLLTLSLRIFKEGSFSSGMVIRGPRGEFGRTGISHNKNMQRYSSGAGSYSFTTTEIKAFVSFWRKFRRIMEMDRHYLEIPVRRMRSAGTRAEKADALVDCVIGLEALLATESERTELAYRFRIRGSVLLSDKRSERKEHVDTLRDLYDLRSRLVHGSRVPAQDLEKYLPLAENALRKVWRWFFTYWHDRKDNKEGVARIDQELVGK